jgi:hypothetical protein
VVVVVGVVTVCVFTTVLVCAGAVTVLVCVTVVGWLVVVVDWPVFPVVEDVADVAVSFVGDVAVWG